MQDRALFAYTFDKADGENPALKYTHRYVKHWTKVKAQGQIYNVVDSRYLSRLPFIITTNLTLPELKGPKDIAHARIYDRILARCTPVRFSGRNYRTENAENTKKAIRDIFTEEDYL